MWGLQRITVDKGSVSHCRYQYAFCFCNGSSDSVTGLQKGKKKKKGVLAVLLTVLADVELPEIGEVCDARWQRC